jgi:hypothetical protein
MVACPKKKIKILYCALQHGYVILEREISGLNARKGVSTNHALSRRKLQAVV